MTARDLTRLLGVHPVLILALKSIFIDMNDSGHPMFVIGGVRTTAEQQVLYAKGRSTPGFVITMCDGIKHRSPHQTKPDGYGHAVDCAFVVGPGADPFSLHLPWEKFGETVERHNLIWGGRFHHPVDLDHVELPYSQNLGETTRVLA